MKEITCQTCGQQAPRTGPVQKYCGTCSEQRDLLRKRKWASEKAKPRTPEETRVTTSERADRKEAVGIKRNGTTGLTWMASDGPDLAWMVRVTVPFTYRMSKNAIWATSLRGHVFLRKEARAARDQLTLALKSAMRGKPVVSNKLWIDIHVAKTNHRGDAVNVVDSVCDAIKAAIPLDDRWYCIRRLDWSISKSMPQLIVGIGQEDVVDSQACAVCGQVKAFPDFSRNKSNDSGFARECLECRRAIGKKEGRSLGRCLGCDDPTCRTCGGVRRD